MQIVAEAMDGCLAITRYSEIKEKKEEKKVQVLIV